MDERSGRGITVVGEGRVTGTPDIASLNLGFGAEEPSLLIARQEVADSMIAVLESIRQLGVPDQDIRTVALDVYYDPERSIYSVEHRVRVIVRNVAASGALLDGAIEAGANRVNGLSFGIADRAALEREAREGAMRDAAAKASQLARLGGVELGAPLAISEELPERSGPAFTQFARDTMEYMEYAASPIQSGEMEVTVRVRVLYAIR